MLNTQTASFNKRGLLMFILVVPVSITVGLLLSQGYMFVAIGFCFLTCACLALRNMENLFLFWLLVSPLVMTDSIAFFSINTHPILTFDRIIIGIIFIIVLIQGGLRLRKLLPINKFEIAMILLFLILISSIIFKSENKLRGARVFTDAFLYPFIIYLLAKNLITNDKIFGKFINVFLFISIYLALIGIFEYFSQVDLFPTKVGIPIRSGWLRVTGPYINDVAFAINLSICFFVVLYKFVLEFLYRKKRIFQCIFFLFVLCLILISIIFTFLRAVWLALICAFLLWILLRKKGRIKLIIVISLMSLIVLFGFDFIKDTFIYKDRIAAIGPIESRLMIYDRALFLFKESPISGIGFENFYYWTKNKDISPYTHNTFLSFLTETGILGFAAIMIIIFIIFKEAYKYYAKSTYQLDREFSIVFFCILICFFMPWLSQECGYYPEINKLFFAILGVVMSRSKRYQNMNISK